MSSGSRMAPRWALLGLVVLLVVSLTAPAAAHDFRPAVLSLSEIPEEDGAGETRDQAPDESAAANTDARGSGRYRMRWTPPKSARASEEKVAPIFPPHCKVGPAALDCGAQGLTGTLSFSGLAGSNVEVVVQIERTDGSARTEVLSGDRPELELEGGLGRGGATAQLAFAYIAIGVEHILVGFDHLMFVLGLILVVGITRDLLWTITAFTVAHSITLACSVLGLFTLPSAPVETTIALSILLVATEALHERPTLTRRMPWLVSFGFGLIHGFGFSGALQEIGMPDGQVPLALLCFNVGVELGQLAVVGALFVVYLGLDRLRARSPALADKVDRGRVVMIYAMGAVAAYWTIDRFARLLLQ